MDVRSIYIHVLTLLIPLYACYHMNLHWPYEHWGYRLPFGASMVTPINLTWIKNHVYMKDSVLAS